MSEPLRFIEQSESVLVTPRDAAAALEIREELVDRLIGVCALRTVPICGQCLVVASDVDRLLRGLGCLESLPESTETRLLTPAEVAARFGVHPKTVLGWAQSGRLHAVRTLGGHRRFRERDVLHLMAQPPPRH